MTIEEAKELLKKGECLTHRFFSPNEYIKKVNGLLMDENELKINERLFWDFRRDTSWQQDWGVYEF